MRASALKPTVDGKGAFVPITPSLAPCSVVRPNDHVPTSIACPSNPFTPPIGNLITTSAIYLWGEEGVSPSTLLRYPHAGVRWPSQQSHTFPVDHHHSMMTSRLCWYLQERERKHYRCPLTTWITSEYEPVPAPLDLTPAYLGSRYTDLRDSCQNITKILAPSRWC